MLETIWFLLWGLLWGIYFMLDGFDLGLGTLMPFLARTEDEKRYVYNAMGPFWDGNEVWLITAGGVTFAAFPTTYAVMFSGLYTPLLLILFALIIRGVSFEFRSKLEGAGWRSIWDKCLVIGSFLPALLLGVAFANIFKGLPLDVNGNIQGTTLDLLNPYGLAGGLLFVLLFTVHGAIWGAIKMPQALAKRATSMASGLWNVLLVVAVAFLIATWFATPLYDNYLNQPVLFLVPLAAVLSLLSIKALLIKGAHWKAWFASSATIVFTTLFGVIGLFPNMLPSTIDPSYSITAFNGSSSPLTLKIMLGVALVMVPVVLAYQIWAYNLFKHRLDQDDLDYEEAY